MAVAQSLTHFSNDFAMLERASLLAWPRVSIPFITTAVKLVVLWVDWVSELNVCLLTTRYP